MQKKNVTQCSARLSSVVRSVFSWRKAVATLLLLKRGKNNFSFGGVLWQH
jgi:hypothetical protein